MLTASRSASAAVSAANKSLLQSLALQKVLRARASSTFFSPVVWRLMAAVGALLTASEVVSAENLHSGAWRPSAVGCVFSSPAELGRPVTVVHVYDGDTVRLADGREVRLLGINTPELKRAERPGQPYAKAASKFLAGHVKRGHARFLVVGSERRDRYGRSLGYLLDRDGVSMGSRLVASGLAFWVAQGGDVSHVDCFRQLEAEARLAELGVWGGAYWQPLQAANLKNQQLGFRIITGRVTQVDQVKVLSFVELDNRLVLRISTSGSDWRELLNRSIEVRGWVVRRKLSREQKLRGFKPYLMHVSNEQQWVLVP